MIAALVRWLSPYLVPVAFAAGIAVGTGGAALWDRWIDDPAVARRARETCVADVERVAAEARAAELARQNAALRAARDGYRLALVEADRRNAETAQRLETEIASHETELAAAGRSCLLDGADVEWLRKP